jgi:ATP-dependent RNA helicase HelY
VYEEFPVTKVIAELERDNLLPAILFRTSRRQCDADLTALNRSRRGKLPEESQELIRKEVNAIIEKYQIPEEVIREHLHYQVLITVGVGAHHAGQLLAWRLLLEELMSRGLLRLMIATGTVAAGVDFPARSVVITAHSKRGSEGFNILTSSEFMQMAGRAGRRGKDAVGLCIVAPSPFSDARVIHEVAQRPPEPLRSAYFAAPSTVLNLLKFRNVDDLRFTVEKSLAAFLDKKSATALREEAEERMKEVKPGMKEDQIRKIQKRGKRLFRDADLLEKRQVHLLDSSLEGLEHLGYIEGKALTEKGVWAAELCTSLVLELGEAVAEHVFDDLSIEEFAGLVGSIAGDPHRPYFNIKANPLRKELFQRMQDIVDRVRESYQNPFTNEVAVLPDAALTVITWMGAESWSDFAALLRLARVAEGDVARLVTQTADHLNQLSRLNETHPVLAEAATEARRRILRPPLSDTIVAD